MTQPHNPQQPYGQPVGGQPVGGQPVTETHATQTTAPVHETTQTTTQTATTGPVYTPGAAAEPVKKKNPLMRFLLPLLGLIVLGVGGAILSRVMFDNNFMKTGQCVTLDSSSDGWKKADCNAAGLTYTVGKTGNGSVAQCNGDAYLEFTASQRVRRSKINKYACLMPNFKEGACYVENGSGNNSDLKEATCGSPKSFKILKKVGEGNATCPQGDAWHYADEKVTYCIGA